MRANAKRHGKNVPSRVLLSEIVETSQMKCPSCGVKMNWRIKDGTKTIATLQHDRSGEIKLLCLSCNTRHAQFENDSFYSNPENHHPCRCCKQVLLKTEFNKDKSRPLGIKSYCKKCSYEKYKQWASTNREQINKQQRDRRASS
jgi:hypothetical protein